MSFFSNPNNVRPGPIECNPLAGLRHRVAVSATRILDSAMRKETHENTRLVIDPRLPPPVKFISADSIYPSAEISNLNISRIQERPTFARVTCDLNVPIQVVYEDQTGSRHVGRTNIAATEDIILFVPGESIFPFEIVCRAQAVAPAGKVVNGDVVATVCLTMVMKVVTEADILLPTYGHVPAPPAVSFEEDACKGFFDLPLYPTGK